MFSEKKQKKAYHQKFYWNWHLELFNNFWTDPLLNAIYNQHADETRDQRANIRVWDILEESYVILFQTRNKHRSITIDGTTDYKATFGVPEAGEWKKLHITNCACRKNM